MEDQRDIKTTTLGQIISLVSILVCLLSAVKALEYTYITPWAFLSFLGCIGTYAGYLFFREPLQKYCDPA